MDPLVVLLVVALACVATWFARGLWDEHRALRARLDRLLRGQRVDLAIEAERAEARTRAALEYANLAWSGERRSVVVDLQEYRRARRRGGAA